MLPPASPTSEWIWMLPEDLCDAEHPLTYYQTHQEALDACLAHNCSGLANKSELAYAYFPAVHFQVIDRCPDFGWVADDDFAAWFWGHPNRSHLDNGCAARYTDLSNWAGGLEAEFINLEKGHAYCKGCPLDLHECTSPTSPPPTSPPPAAPGCCTEPADLEVYPCANHSDIITDNSNQCQYRTIH